MKIYVSLLALTLTLMGCWQKDVGRSVYLSGKVFSEAVMRNGLLAEPVAMFYESNKKIGGNIANMELGRFDLKV
jgi:hypothetical protein